MKWRILKSVYWRGALKKKGAKQVGRKIRLRVPGRKDCSLCLALSDIRIGSPESKRLVHKLVRFPYSLRNLII